VDKAVFVEQTDGPLDVAMHNSDATGRALLKNGPFAADLIRFPRGGRVELHVHPGTHMLFCVSGTGKVQYEDELHQLEPGVCYLIEDSVPHAIFGDAGSELTLIAVANDHYALDSARRLERVQGTDAS